jgi:CRISPR-associated protein Cas6
MILGASQHRLGDEATYLPRQADLVFDIAGRSLPQDHASALFEAVSATLPWLGKDLGSGAHAIKGAANEHGELIINRRAKLVLRIPRTRMAEARALSGKHLALAGYEIDVGAASERAFVPFATLYAPLLLTGRAREEDFAADLMALLSERGIEHRFICGKPRGIHRAGETLRGHSLMLYDLSMDQSLRIQDEGLGLHRELGCGMFVPHKSIAPVMPD